MKHILLLPCLLLLAACLAGCQTGSATSSSPSAASPTLGESDTQSDVRVLLEQWHRAIFDRDIATLDDIWADDYLSVNPSGQIVPKNEDLRLVASTDLTFDKLLVQDVTIPVKTRSFVVVTSITLASGVYRGDPFGGQFRNTTVFEKRFGKWKAVWGQSTEIPASGGQ